MAKRGAVDDDSSSPLVVVGRKKCLELSDKLYASGGLAKELTRCQLCDDIRMYRNDECKR